MAKKEMLVTAIENGTVIDHIPAEKTYKVANLLKLDTLTTPVTIGNYLESKKVGHKGIIKVSGKFSPMQKSPNYQYWLLMPCSTSSRTTKL